MNSADDSGFVRRGLLLLAGMTVLGLVVLAIVLYRPAPRLPVVPEDLPAASAPGWQIRYNAAVTLARRGGDQVTWNVIGEMLDEKQQLKNYPVPLADGREVPDEAAARATMLTALRAVAEWHRKQVDRKAAVPAGLKDVYSRVDQLAQSPIPELRVQAESVRQAFFR